MYVTVEGGGGEKNHYLLNIYLDLDKYKKKITKYIPAKRTYNLKKHIIASFMAQSKTIQKDISPLPPTQNNFTLTNILNYLLKNKN